MTTTEIRREVELAINELSAFVNTLTGNTEWNEKIKAGRITEQDIETLKATHKPGQLGRLSREEFEDAAAIRKRLGQLYNSLREVA